MAIEFRCTTCNKLLRVGDESAGKTARCPDCQTLLTIPWATQAEARPDDERAGAPSPAAWTAPPDNPFSPPETSGFPGTVPGKAPPSGAVTAVAVVNYIVGALGVLCGMGIMLLGGVIGNFFAELAKEDPELAPLANVPGVVVVILGVIVAGLSLIYVVAGYGVQRRWQWGRILTLVLGGLSAVAAMFDLISLSPTIVINGGYAALVFIVLLNKKYAAEFG